MQFVVFKLGEEHFAVETKKVQSINDMMKITEVPKAPPYIKGLINLRGSIKSLVDINLLLNITSTNEEKNIIIIKLDEEEIGISVEEVEEVIEVDESIIQKLPLGSSKKYIKGIINLNGKLLTVIEIENLINK